MRAMVFGDTASGKSTFANNLGELFEVPVIHLDELMEQVGRDNRCDIKELIHDEADKSEWIIEGNAFTKDPDYRIQRAETIFAFDFGRLTTITAHIARHRRIQNGTEQRIGSSSSELNLGYFVPYTLLKFPPRKRAAIEKAKSLGKEVISFNNRNQATTYLGNVR